MTQRDEIVALVGKLDTEKTRDLATKIGNILGRAQNRPEYGGEADGSVSEPVYSAAHDATRALHQLADTIDRLHIMLGREGA